MGYYVVSDGTAKPYRVHMRNPIFATLQALQTMCEGRLLADVVAVIGSIDIVLGRDRPVSDDVVYTVRACARKLWISLVSCCARMYAAMSETPAMNMPGRRRRRRKCCRCKHRGHSFWRCVSTRQLGMEAGRIDDDSSARSLGEFRLKQDGKFNFAGRQPGRLRCRGKWSWIVAAEAFTAKVF